MGDSGRSVTKKVKAGTIDLDPDESALIVNCFIETTVLEDGEPVSKERKPMQKIVPVPIPLSQDDCIRLAEEIVRSCKYVLKAQQPTVEQLLYRLHQHITLQEGHMDMQDETEVACMDNLEAYLEMLYEGQDDMSEKIKGTGLILQLAQDVGNLEMMIQDHTLMGALSRVLYDEFRKSMELTYNIARIFLAFSNFVEMHDILMNYKVGSLTMKVVEMELKKAEHRDEERKKRLEDGSTGGGGGAGAGAKEERGPPSKALTLGGGGKDDGKAKALMKKQDKLLFVCMYILLNLATDTSTEKKMVKKSLAEFLVCLLDRVSYDLVLLVVTFLKKLSVYEDNLSALKQSDVVSRLVRLTSCGQERLVESTLRLLFNLSFDSVLREQMVKNSLIPKLVELLKKPPFRAKILRLLYQLSVDDRCKSMFTYTEAIPIVKELVINFPRTLLTHELAALAINLTWNGRNAELMCQRGGLKRLMDRVLDKRDPLLMKVVRNISNWTLNNQFELTDPVHEYRYRSLWPPHIKALLSLVTETENNDLLVEGLGTLANLTPLDLPLGSSWANYIQDYDLLSFCKRLLVPVMAQNDVVLEVINLIGAFALDPSAASDMASSNIIRSLHEAWTDMAEDAEIVLQALYTLYRLMRHAETREVVLFVDYKDKKAGVQQTRIVMDMMEMLSHRNSEVRRVADMCMDLVLECDRDDDGLIQDFGAQIRRKRFEAYNREWCEAVWQEDNDDSPMDRRRSVQSGAIAARDVDWSSNVLHGEKLAMRMDDLMMGRSGALDHEEEEDDDESPHMAQDRWGHSPGGLDASWEGGWGQSPAY